MVKRLLAWLLAAFFCFGAWSNVYPSEAIIGNYSRWGYPDWFHYVTAAMELTVAVLLIAARTRWLGAITGVVVMVAAVATVTAHDGIRHAALPVSILVLLVITAVSSIRTFGIAGRRNESS